MNVEALAQVLYEEQNKPAKWETAAGPSMRESWIAHAEDVMRKVEAIESQPKDITYDIVERILRIEKHLGMR